MVRAEAPAKHGSKASCGVGEWKGVMNSSEVRLKTLAAVEEIARIMVKK